MKNCPSKNLGERVHWQMKRRPVGGGSSLGTSADPQGWGQGILNKY